MEVKINPDSFEIQQIFGDNFIRLNKELIQVFGLINAVVLCNFKEKDLYFRKFKNSDGSFFLDKKSQEKELNLGSHTMRIAIKQLAEFGVLSIERKGVPPRYWYGINYSKILNMMHLYRCENRTFKDAISEPIINKIKENKIKPNLKDICNAPSEQLPNESKKQKPSKSTKKKISPTDRIKAERILSKYNEYLKIFKQKTNQAPTDGWKVSDANIRTIVDRLMDNYVYKDFVKILATKIYDPWFIDKPYLYVPNTLFGEDKFEKYRHEDPKQYEKKQPGVANGSGISGNIDYSFRPGRDMKIKVDKTNWGKYDNE